MIHYLDNAERTRLTAALTALETGPTEADLASAPVLDGWNAAVMGKEAILVGQVHGHPVAEGEVYTSPVLMLDVERGIARTISRWYRIGYPLDEAATDLVEKLMRPRSHLRLVQMPEFERTVSTRLTAYRKAIAA